MDSFSLDRRVTIQVNQPSIDPDYGTSVDNWTTFDGAERIAANVQDVLPSKSEQVKQGIRVATRPARVRIRFMPGVTSDMRVIVHDDADRVCQIVGGPAELGRRQWLEMVVEEYSV
jgi:head-tail adaptor